MPSQYSSTTLGVVAFGVALEGIIVDGNGAEIAWLEDDGGFGCGGA